SAFATLAHDSSAQTRDAEEGPGAEGSGRAEGDELAVAMAGGHIGPDAELLEKRQQTGRKGAQRGLRSARVGQLAALVLGRFLAERGRRKEEAAETAAVPGIELGVGAFEHIPPRAQVERGLLTHAGVLRALAREEERDGLAEAGGPERDRGRLYRRTPLHGVDREGEDVEQLSSA